MPPRRELLAFAAVLAVLVASFFVESLFCGKVLSPADVLFASASFAAPGQADYEPLNRLLMDPVLQFQPWLEFNRAMIRQGRLPLWNPLAGCGAPHLANGQSAVFDPFHAIAYVGSLPEAYAWMAAARLWVAGLGMFLLASAWGFGAWGRWFAGLAFPFCGFLIVWLLYPVASVAVWMPWLFWACDRLLDRPSVRSVAGVAAFVGLTLLGGHIQTSAHVLIAAALYLAWRVFGMRAQDVLDGTCEPIAWRVLPACGAGFAWGILLGAVSVVPLGFYLARSPVWSDRSATRTPAWQFTKPRPLDAVCTALPYAYGSQRRGQPNLARALGVHNLNESAGGFAGLATLIWMAPLAWTARGRKPRVRFLAGLVALGALAAFRVPPVDNLLRALPVLNVTDNRRLTLWVAFGLVALGGIGLDNLLDTRQGRGWGRWMWVWVVAAIGMLGVAGSVRFAEPWLRSRAHDHYAQASAESPGASLQSERAERQVRQTLSFVPRYLTLSAAQLLALAALAALLRRGEVSLSLAQLGLLGLTIVDLYSFGYGLNPAIRREDDRPASTVIAYLRKNIGPSARVLAIGAELPPNTLMRYGLADLRNYDSVEVERSLSYFSSLYEPGRRRERTSRRQITWNGAIQSAGRLGAAGVGAIVGATPPPAGAFDRVDRAGAVWVARLPCSPLISTASGQAISSFARHAGSIQVEFRAHAADRIVVLETFDPGWRATVEGQSVAIEPHLETFMAVPISAGTHSVTLRYDPPEVRFALAVSCAALALHMIALLIPNENCRKTQTIGLDGSDRSGYNRSCDLHRTCQPISH